MSGKAGQGTFVYRPEIDGLRAIAVLCVLLYHAEFSFDGVSLLRGGYIGVDIFFVISGYLITRIILNEFHATGDISLPRFYERRARRLLPMLFIVALACFPAAWLVLLPGDFLELSESILTSILFASNIYFYDASTQYGATLSLFKPFLHSWSLGVEEQFYLGFPVITLFVLRWGESGYKWFLVGGALASLAAAEVLISRDPEFGFYMPFTRFWELFVGAWIAHREVEIGRRLAKSEVTHWSRIMPFVGILSIGAALYLFDGNSPHPGMVTLLPVIGTALIIQFGSMNTELVSRFLAARILVAIGLISYSCYLWHFPVFAFARHLNLFDETYQKLVGLLVTLGLSIISYYAIERPFRRRSVISTALLCQVLAGLLLVLVGLYGAGLWTSGYKQRFAEPLQSAFYEKTWRTLKDERGICQNRLSDFCEFNQGADKKLYLIGDSVLSSALPYITEHFTDYHIVTATSGFCYYAPGAEQYDPKTKNPTKERCTAGFQAEIRNRLLSEEQEAKVVFGGQLSNYLGNANRLRYSNGEAVTAAKLVEAMTELQSNKNLSLFFVPPTPLFHPIKYKQYLAGLREVDISDAFYQEDVFHYNHFRNQSEDFFEMIRILQLGKIADMREVFCNSESCVAMDGGRLMMIDHHHFTRIGAEAYGKKLRRVLEKVEF